MDFMSDRSTRQSGDSSKLLPRQAKDCTSPLPSLYRRHPRRGDRVRLRLDPRAAEIALRKLQSDLDWWLPGRDKADPALATLMNAALSFQWDMPWQAAALLVMLRVNAVPAGLDPVFAAIDHLVAQHGANFVLEALCLSESLEVASDGPCLWLEWSYGHTTPLSSQLGGWERLRRHAARLSSAAYADLVELAQIWRGRGELPLRCSLSYLCSDQFEWAADDLAECLDEPGQFPAYGWRLLATLNQVRLVEDLLRRYGQYCSLEWMWCLVKGLGRQAGPSLEILRQRWGHRNRRALDMAIKQI